MKKHNPANERIKRKYFRYLKEAKRHSEPTIDAAAKALNRFEVYNKFLDFKSFHFEQAIAFKRHLAAQKAQRSGKKLSKATLHSTLSHLKRFFNGCLASRAINLVFTILMPSISTSLIRTQESLRQNGIKLRQLWNRSNTLSTPCLQKLTLKNATVP